MSLNVDERPREHWSSCAVHNGPGLPVGPCDCGGLESESISELAAEASVGPPVEGAIVHGVVGAAQGGRKDVVDLPAIIALRSVVRPPNDIPVSIESVNGGVELLEWLTRRPSGELIEFLPPKAVGEVE